VAGGRLDGKFEKNEAEVGGEKVLWGVGELGAWWTNCNMHGPLAANSLAGVVAALRPPHTLRSTRLQVITYLTTGLHSTTGS
jgi:hypothetical protein